MAALDKEQVRALLPKVGDRVMERPFTFQGETDTSKRPCTVVEVHPDRFWYTVEFDNGLRESYKLPRATYKPNGRRLSE